MECFSSPKQSGLHWKFGICKTNTLSSVHHQKLFLKDKKPSVIFMRKWSLHECTLCTQTHYKHIPHTHRWGSSANQSKDPETLIQSHSHTHNVWRACHASLKMAIIFLIHDVLAQYVWYGILYFKYNGLRMWITI